MVSQDRFISEIPKAELHLHIEGTFEPELMFEIAERNNKAIRYDSVEDLKRAYKFNNLQEFLDIYYEGTSVLVEQQDFYDLTTAYIEKAHSQKVLHTEIFFDPQAHTVREVEFDTVVKGITRALEDGKKRLGISSKLIMCFLRHLDQESALDVLNKAKEYKEVIAAVGLDSSEVGHPPSKFYNAFKAAKEEGFLTVAHAGEEGPPEYIHEALDLLGVDRIDHGNRAMEDHSLVEELVRRQIPLTVCPLSNLKLQVVKNLKDHPLKKMLQKGLLATINSDDPAYFGGYINENYNAITQALGLSEEDLHNLAKNSFKASFLSNEEKRDMLDNVDSFVEGNEYS